MMIGDRLCSCEVLRLGSDRKNVKHTLKRGMLPTDGEFRLPSEYVVARRIDLLQTWYAVATAQHGSMRHAAVMLNVRQPTLSRKINDMEAEIGITLFERSTRGAFPTRVAHSFVRQMEHILHKMDEMVVTARSIGLGDAGRLTVEFSTSLSAGNLRATLMEFARRFPDVEVSAVEGSRKRLFPALQWGHIDIAIVAGELPPNSGRSKHGSLLNENSGPRGSILSGTQQAEGLQPQPSVAVCD